MSKYKVVISGLNTNDIKVLKASETKELLILMKNGDLKAREKLIEGMLKRFGKYDGNMDDLFQIGCVGLVKAIDNFDLSQDVKLSTYAVPMILGEIKRYLRDNSSIRVSRSVKDIAYKTLKLKEELTMKNGKEPTIEEMAEILDIDIKDMVNAIESLIPPTSLFEPIYNDGGDTIYLFDQIEDKKSSIDLEVKLAIEKAILKLSDREQFILDQRFFMGKTQMEISEELGISQAQISRLEKNALTRIRKQL